MERLPITDPSQVSEVRRRAVKLAESLGFDENDAGKAAILVTEAATNLIKHAGGGEILLGSYQEGALQEKGPAAGRTGLQVLALDRGPGIASLKECLRDGHSTSGSPGTGLGAMARISTTFDIHSRPGSGTAVLLRLLPGSPGGRAPKPGPLELGAISIAKPGEEACGDGWAMRVDEGRILILIVDGLGHGPAAAEAAAAAARTFQEGRGPSCGQRLEEVHLALRPTRGAAGAVVEVCPSREVITYAGLGNTAGSIWNGTGCRRMVSLDGTLGHEARRIGEFQYPFPPGSLLVLHTDGLSARFDLQTYPGLATRHPALAAAVLYRDFDRRSDDVSVVALRMDPR